MTVSQPKTIQLAVGALVLVVLYQLLTTYGNRSVVEKMAGSELGGLPTQGPLSEVGPFEEKRDEGGNEASVVGMQGRIGGDTGKQALSSALSAAELLPKGVMGATAGVEPASASDLKGIEFFSAGPHAEGLGGINTRSVGNPLYEVRAELPNPQGAPPDTNKSTFGPDTIRASKSIF